MGFQYTMANYLCSEGVAWHAQQNGRTGIDADSTSGNAEDFTSRFQSQIGNSAGLYAQQLGCATGRERPGGLILIFLAISLSRTWLRPPTTQRGDK